jgi:hypothetical protein
MLADGGGDTPAWSPLATAHRMMTRIRTATVGSWLSGQARNCRRPLLEGGLPGQSAGVEPIACNVLLGDSATIARRTILVPRDGG